MVLFHFFDDVTVAFAVFEAAVDPADGGRTGSGQFFDIDKGFSLGQQVGNFKAVSHVFDFFDGTQVFQ